MTMTATAPGFDKPINLRIIFILNALKILLALGFFVAFKYYDFSVGELRGDAAASVMLYTMFGYIAAFIGMVISILKRVVIGLRVAIIADFLVSIPGKAFIGFAIALISIALTFTNSVRAYFAYRKA